MKDFSRLRRIFLLGCALLALCPALCPGYGTAAGQSEGTRQTLQAAANAPAAAPGAAAATIPGPAPAAPHTPPPGATPERAAPPALPPLTPAAASPAPPGSAPQEAPASAAPLPDIKLSWAGYFQALGILCLALAALWAVLWVFKRRGGFGGALLSGGPSMRVESRLALGPKKWIFVVRCLDRRLVIGVSDQNMTLLTEIHDEAHAAQPGEKTVECGNAAAPGPHFASFLQKDK